VIVPASAAAQSRAGTQATTSAGVGRHHACAAPAAASTSSLLGYIVGLRDKVPLGPGSTAGLLKVRRTPMPPDSPLTVLYLQNADKFNIMSGGLSSSILC